MVSVKLCQKDIDQDRSLDPLKYNLKYQMKVLKFKYPDLLARFFDKKTLVLIPVGGIKSCQGSE
jgi:hypothetical protein